MATVLTCHALFAVLRMGTDMEDIGEHVELVFRQLWRI